MTKASELEKYIKQYNGNLHIWATQGPNRIVCPIIEDMDFWKERGITTVEQFQEQEDLEHKKQMRKNAYEHFDIFDDMGDVDNDLEIFND